MKAAAAAVAVFRFAPSLTKANKKEKLRQTLMYNYTPSPTDSKSSEFPPLDGLSMGRCRADGSSPIFFYSDSRYGKRTCCSYINVRVYLFHVVLESIRMDPQPSDSSSRSVNVVETKWKFRINPGQPIDEAPPEFGGPDYIRFQHGISSQ